jgi:hypothetical protein
MSPRRDRGMRDAPAKPSKSSDVQSLTPCPEWKDHDFKEEYYGYECKRCGLFFAYGCAPWEESRDEIQLDENDFIGDDE